MSADGTQGARISDANKGQNLLRLLIKALYVGCVKRQKEAGPLKEPASKRLNFTIVYLFGTTTNCVPCPRFTRSRVESFEAPARTALLNSATVFTGLWFT